jgi:hypothetical protein
LTRPVVAALAVTATLLAGCAASGQRYAQQNWAAAQNDFKARVAAAYTHFGTCNKAVNDEAVYASLAPHNYEGSPPARLLADTTLPTPEDARLILRRWDERNGCRNDLITAAGELNRPDAAQILTATFAAMAELDARFSQRHMTWGDFIRNGSALWQDGQQRITAADEVRRQQLTQAAAQDAAARRDNAVAAAAILGAMRPVYQPQQPQTIYVAPCTLNAQIARAC